MPKLTEAFIAALGTPASQQKTFDEYRRHCEAVAYDIESAHLQFAYFNAEKELRKIQKQLEKKIAKAKDAFEKQDAVITARYADSPKMRERYDAFLKTGDDNPYDSEPMRSKYVKYLANAMAEVAASEAEYAARKAKREKA